MHVFDNPALFHAKFVQEPSSPKDSPVLSAQPVSLAAQNELRSSLRNQLRRTRRTRSKRDLLKDEKKKRSGAKGKAGKRACADEGSEAEAPPLKRVSTAASSRAAAKPKDKAVAKSKLPLPKAKAKAKAKAACKDRVVPAGKAKAKAKAKAAGKPDKPGKEPLRPDYNYTGYSEDGSLILGCSTCRWAVLGCWMCLRPCFRGVRWNAVACGDD